MDWGSDELHHRSAEQSGWCAALRAADPEDVDETIPGAVEYAAQTSSLPGDGDAPDVAALDDDADSDAGPDGYVCALCSEEIPGGEALDSDGAPVDVGFQWVGEVEAYHRSCIENGDGRFLPWAANGILRDETTS
jgi:hypothetical protein